MFSAVLVPDSYSTRPHSPQFVQDPNTSKEDFSGKPIYCNVQKQRYLNKETTILFNYFCASVYEKFSAQLIKTLNHKHYEFQKLFEKENRKYYKKYVLLIYSKD